MLMNKLILSILMVSFGILIVMGLASGLIENLPEPVNINECANLVQVDNVTTEYITSIVKPNEIAVINSFMQKNGTFFNYTFCDNDVYGAYTVNGQDNTGTVWAYDYLVGSELEIGKAIVYVLIIAILFILLVFSVVGINKAIKGEWQIFYITVSYLLLFSLTFILWLFSQNYLYDIEILETIFWIVWLILGILFLPFIIGVSGYILKKQAEGLMVEDYQKQGYNKQDSLDMAKSRKR